MRCLEDQINQKQQVCSEVLALQKRLKPRAEMVSLEEDLKERTEKKDLFKVPGSVGIYVDEQGSVFSVKVFKLKVVDDEYGYKKVHCRDGKKKHFTLHRMIAKTFLLNPLNDNEVRHLDGIKKNNSPSNLAWGTRIQNVKDKIIHRTYYKGGKSLKLNSKKVIEIRFKSSQGESFKSLAREYCVSAHHIRNIVNRSKWKWL